MDRTTHLIFIVALGSACATPQSVRSGFVHLECPTGTVRAGNDHQEMWCVSAEGRRVGPHITWEDGVYLAHYKETDSSGKAHGYEVIFVSGTPSICRQYEHGEPCGEWLKYRSDSRLLEAKEFMRCPPRPFPLKRWASCRELVGAGAPL